MTRIDIHYEQRKPAGTRDNFDRALSRHREKCPTAQSLRAAVPVEWTADVNEDATD